MPAFSLAVTGTVELCDSYERPALPPDCIAAKVETVIAEPVADEEAATNGAVVAGV
jgi:hypothetical protein